MVIFLFPAIIIPLLLLPSSSSSYASFFPSPFSFPPPAYASGIIFTSKMFSSTLKEVPQGFLLKNNSIYACENECCENLRCLEKRNKNGDLLVQEEEEVLLVFGGRGTWSQEATKNCYLNFSIKCQEYISNNLTFYFLTQKIWSSVFPSTSSPSPRYGHQGVLVEVFDEKSQITRKYFYMYGGISPDGVCSDFWAYEIPWMNQANYPFSQSDWNRGNRWREITSSPSPGSRAFHSMIYVKGFIYVFGGISNDTLTNDMWSFNVKTEKWKMLQGCEVEEIKRKGKVWDGGEFERTVGKEEKMFSSDLISYVNTNDSSSCYSDRLFYPSCRFLTYAFYSDSDDRIFLFGGISSSKDNNFSFENDFWAFNLNELVEKNCYKFEPIFEFSDLNTNYNIYQKPNPNGGGSIFKILNTSYVGVFGGANEVKVLQDFFLYNQNMQKWLNFTEYFDDLYDSTSNNQIYLKGLIGTVMVPFSKGVLLYGGMTFGNNSENTDSIIQNASEICGEKYKEKGINSFNNLNNFLKKEKLFFQKTDGGDPCYKNQFFLNDVTNLYSIYNTNQNIILFAYNYSCEKTANIGNDDCFFGERVCKNKKFYGKNCDLTLCEGSLCYYDEESLGEEFCMFCSKHGKFISQNNKNQDLLIINLNSGNFCTLINLNFKINIPPTPPRPSFPPLPLLLPLPRLLLRFTFLI